MVTRLTSPLAKLGDYARKLPEQDFMEDARPTPLLAALADGKHGGEIASLANSLMFMDKTLRSRVRELMEATSSRERLEGELSAATEIQMGFLPKPLPPDVAAGRFSLAASLVPAREVGGDLYDFFMLDDRHRLSACSILIPENCSTPTAGTIPRFGSATTAWHGSKASAGLWSARWKA